MAARLLGAPCAPLLRLPFLRAAPFVRAGHRQAGPWSQLAARQARQQTSFAAQAAVLEQQEAPASHAAAQDSEALGFDLVRDEYVAEYASQVHVYRHRKTGAEVMSLANSDENKVFGVVLRTPVDSSKGTPHILEHSVLCGSRKFPTKEPFVELLKGSLQTFLNAFTYPDRTCYPVASCNLQDFYNLVDVYLDAVLFPKCVNDPQTFAQEGWHYELDSAQEPLTFKGVVFNEMKGVYSSPDARHQRIAQNAMFPDNTYAVDSGGDPAVIPDLTFEEFRSFHQRYYHPSNARFYFYGDDPPAERLRILAAYLDEFEALPVDSTVHPQPLFQEERRVQGTYAAGQQGREGTCYVSLNWVLAGDGVDVETELALEFLDHLLLGTDAAPLRQALNDSGLGEQIIGGGYGGELRQPTFSLGLKGVKPEDSQKVVDLIQDMLGKIADKGFTPTAIEATMNTIEFELRENNTGSFPRGLSLMLRAMAPWLYGRDPLAPLHWTRDLEHLKARLASGEPVFQDLIRERLLQNRHRVLVEVRPDQGLGEQEEAAEKARLEQVKAGLQEAQLQAVVTDTAALKERQETPDPPEALASIPSLKIDDVPKTASTIPSEVTPLGASTLLTHDLFTNDVLYAEAALDMRTVPPHLLPLVPLFCRAMMRMGTAKESFVELTERIHRKTGGISVSPFMTSVRGRPDPAAYVFISGKAVGGKAQDLFGLFSDILLTARLDDKQRFKQMVLETRSSLESGLVQAGHRYAALRLDAQRTTGGWVSEQMGGLSYLMYIRGLADRVDTEWDAIQADLEAIRTALLQRRGALINLTAEGSTLSATQPLVESFLESLPAESAGHQDWSGRLQRRNEAICVPTQVNYVAKAGNLFEDAGYELSGSSFVINKLLGTTWLWDRVRVVGGAYGGFSNFDNHTGQFAFLSYRDPNLVKTLDVYDGTAGFLRDLQLDQDALTKAIVGTIGDVDSHQLPDAKGHTALLRHMLGLTDAERQQRRDEILGTSLKDFRHFAEAVQEVGRQGNVVAVTSAERAEAALKERPQLFDECLKVL